MSKSVKLIQVDGKLPNLALMKLSAYYKDNGSEVDFTRSVHKDLFDKNYEYIFASTIFKFSINRIQKLKKITLKQLLEEQELMIGNYL